jgi:hypothetical protein
MGNACNISAGKPEESTSKTLAQMEKISAWFLKKTGREGVVFIQLTQKVPWQAFVNA